MKRSGRAVIRQFKGPVFESFLNPNHVPVSRDQWVRHQNHRQRGRHLRNACRSMFKETDSEAVTQRDRCIAVIAAERDRLGNVPEAQAALGVLRILNAAREIADTTGEPWWDCLRYLLNQYEAGLDTEHQSSKGSTQMQNDQATP